MGIFGPSSNFTEVDESINNNNTIQDDGPEPSSMGASKRRTIVLAAHKRRDSIVKQNNWDLLCTLIAISVVVGCIALTLESIAYNADKQWNKILSQESGFPDTGEEFFKGKMLIFQPHFQAPERFKVEIHNARNHLMRASTHELIALILLVLFISLQLLLLLAYTQGEEHRKTVNVIHVIGAAAMFACGMLIVTSDMAVDTKHAEVAAALKVYLTYIESLFKPTNGTVGFSDSVVNIGEYEAVRDQVDAMRKIQHMCNLGNSKLGRYGYAVETRMLNIFGQEYTLDQMRDLKFCSLEGVKFAAMFFCLIYSMLCLATAMYIYWADSKRLKKGIVRETQQFDISELSYGPGYSENPGRQYFDFVGSEKRVEPEAAKPEKKKPKEEGNVPDYSTRRSLGSDDLKFKPTFAYKPQDGRKESRWDERDFSRSPHPPIPDLAITGSYLTDD